MALFYSKYLLELDLLERIKIKKASSSSCVTLPLHDASILLLSLCDGNLLQAGDQHKTILSSLSHAFVYHFFQ